jgi:DNA-binding beta-propeller fold protein YncE
MLRSRRGLRATVSMAAAAVAVLLSGVSQPVVKAADSAWHRVENWPQMPPGLKFGTVSGVAVDKKGVVYVFERNTNGDIWMFDKSGKYIGEWGPSGRPGFVKMAHTIHIDPSGFVWITDRTGHQIKKYTPDGSKVLLTIGEFGVPGSDGAHFNGPTGIQFLANGDFIVSDGYWNSRVARFNKDGKFISSVGASRPAKNMDGRGPGNFGLVHAAAQAPNGRLLVSDRCDGPVGPEDEARRNPRCTDSRVQVVEQNGTFVEYWNQLKGPLCLLMVGQKLYTAEGGREGGRVVILDPNTGKELDAIEGASTGAGAHQIAIDEKQDNVYVTDLGNTGSQRTGGNGTVKRFTREK